MVTLKSISSLDYENKIVGHDTGGFTLWPYTILTNRNEPFGRVYLKRKTYNVCVCEGIDSDLAYSKCHVAIYIYIVYVWCPLRLRDHGTEGKINIVKFEYL